MSYAYPKPRQRVWRSPSAEEMSAFLSSRAAPEHAEPPATATESKLLQCDLERHSGEGLTVPARNLLTFWEIWEAMDERGGFYIRKPLWRPSNRFLVANVVEHRDHPGQRIALGRYCEDGGSSHSSRLTQQLELRVWQFAGVTRNRELYGDGELPV